MEYPSGYIVINAYIVALDVFLLRQRITLVHQSKQDRILIEIIALGKEKI